MPQCKRTLLSFRTYVFVHLQAYLKSHGATTIFHISELLLKSAIPCNRDLITTSWHLKQRLEKQADVFYVVRSFAEPENIVVCLQEQKRHLDTTIDATVAYLIEKEGTCSMRDLPFLLSILPEETKTVVARTLAHLEETIRGVEGVEFRIEGDKIVLCNYDRWKLLLGQSTKESKPNCEEIDSRSKDQPEKSEVKPNASGVEFNVQITTSEDSVRLGTTEQVNPNQNVVSSVTDTYAKFTTSGSTISQDGCQARNTPIKFASARSVF